VKPRKLSLCALIVLHFPTSICFHIFAILAFYLPTTSCTTLGVRELGILFVVLHFVLGYKRDPIYRR